MECVLPVSGCTGTECEAGRDTHCLFVRDCKPKSGYLGNGVCSPGVLVCGEKSQIKTRGKGRPSEEDRRCNISLDDSDNLSLCNSVF